MDKDTTLEQRMIQHELVKIQLRCIRKYTACAKKHGGGDFWAKIAPQRMKDDKEKGEGESCPLVMFLNKFTDKVEGATTMKTQFITAYREFLKEEYPSVKYETIKDIHHFQKRGYKLGQYHFCNKIQSAEIFGSHYTGYRVETIHKDAYLNMKLKWA